jgi:hypothetical protein
MRSTLQQLAPDVAALAEFAFRESRRQKWLPPGITFDSWIISAIYERADLLIRHSILGGTERERFVFLARPYITDGKLTIYLEA